MLLRMVLLLKNRELEHFLRKYFHGRSVSIENIGHFKAPFQRALRTSGDIFIIDTDLVPHPLDSSIALLNDLPEKPTTIFLEKIESPEQHADLLALGADVVLYSGLSKKILAEAIEASVDSRLQLARQSWPTRGPDPKARLSSFVGESPRMKFFMEMVQKVISCNSPLLLLGETGTGKELLAKIIHNEGPRSDGPFIAVNCAALPEALLESELFGHDKGAFTGAVRPRRGAFELAHSGTIFLDEIGELPPHMQVKLLRVLQEYEVRPLGSEKCMKVDVRVIAATNVDVEESIRKGCFRQDLYYRLSVFTLSIPPLRERRQDIPLIAKRYLDNFSKKINKNVSTFSRKAIDGLINYNWPGNVRELINVIERAVILCPGDVITPEDLPDEICGQPQGENISDHVLRMICTDWQNRTLSEVKEQLINIVEKSYLEYVLTETGGRVGKAAKLAGIHPRSLYDKMKRYGLNKHDFKRKQTPHV